VPFASRARWAVLGQSRGLRTANSAASNFALLHASTPASQMESEGRPASAGGIRSNATGTSRFGGTGTSPAASLTEQLNALQATIAANRPALSMQNDSVSSRSVSPRFPGFGASPPSPLAGADANRADSPLTPPGNRPSPFSSAGGGRSITPILQRGALQSSSSTALVPGGKSPDSSSSLLNIMRRELEQVEQRLTGQINKVRDSATSSLQKADKLREVALSRLDQKVTICECTQSKLDRKLSEVTGTVRGLSDEAQQHIRRADLQDNRLYEFKNQMEEDFKNKMSELTLQYQEMASKCRTTFSATEDAQKRFSQQVKRLDAVVQEQTTQVVENGVKIEDLQARVDAIEEGYQREAANTRSACEDLVAARRPSLTASTAQDPSINWKYEQQLNDIEQKVERLVNEAHGDDSYDSKLYEFEVRLSGVRSKIDNQETFCSTVEGKLKKDFEQRIDGLRKRMEELCGKQLDVQELLDKQIRGAEATEEALEDLRAAVLQARTRKLDVSDMSSEPQADAVVREVGSATGLRVDALQQDVAAVATQVQLMNSKFASLDVLIAAQDMKEKVDGTGMDQQRLSKVETEVQSLFKALQELQNKLSTEALEELKNKLQTKEVSTEAASAITELRNEVGVIKEKEELLMQQTAQLKDLAVKLSDVQKDTARHCRWAVEPTEPKARDPVPPARENPPEDQAVKPSGAQAGTAEAAADDAAAKVKLLEGRIGKAEEQLRDMRQDLAALSGGQVVSRLAQSGDFAGTNESGYAVMPLLNEADGEIVAQELDGLFQRVEEGEQECVKLQEQLKGRIAHMDKLLDKVAKEVLGPEGAVVASRAGAVESVSRLLPMGLRLCVLGGKEFNNIANRQLVEAVARQVGSMLGGNIVVLTTGNKGVQETFVANLGNTLQVVNLVSATEASGFSRGTDVAAGENHEERMYILGQLGDVYLTVEGGPVVAKEAKAAAQRQAAVIPLKSTGGASAGMFDFPQDALRKPSWATQEQWAKLESQALPDEMAATVVAMLQAILRERGTAVQAG